MASPRKAPLADSDRNRQPCRLMSSYDPSPMKPVIGGLPPDIPRFPLNVPRLQPPASTNSTATSPSLSSNTPSPTRPASGTELLPPVYYPPSSTSRPPTIQPLSASRKRLSSEAFPTELPAIIDPYQARPQPGIDQRALPTRPARPVGQTPPRERPERDTRNSLDFILAKPSDEERRAPPPPPPQATASVLRSHVPGPPSYPPQQYPIPQMHPFQPVPRPYAGQYEIPHPPQPLLDTPLDNRQKRQKSNLEVPPEIDVNGIRLEGEPHGVPVYDTCDTVREKIRSLLRKDGITQAAFLRELGKVYDPPRKLQSKSLNDFLVKTGPRAGNTSCIYYSGYVFFEKKRLRDGEPKTKHREKMEEIYRPKGCNTTEVRNRIYTRVGEHYWEDEYGLVHTS